jgi:hypothetical protein
MTVEETVNTLFKQLQGTDQDKAEALEFIRRPEYLRLRLHPAFVRAVLDLKETGLFGFVDDVDEDEEDVCPHCGHPLEWWQT